MASTLYRRLHSSSDEIRVLVLRPGEGDAPICASLTPTKLHSNLQYEALSYVWDDMNSLGVEVEVQIMTNLESALRHLRLKDRSRILWADAICINQNDPNEKVHQIRNMGDIYRKASSVCMWLGEEANDSDAAMELIDLHRTASLDWKKLPKEKIWSRNCEALTYLVCRPYVVYCGTRSTTWGALYMATYSLNTETHKYQMSQPARGTRLPSWHPFKGWLCSDEHLKSWDKGIDDIAAIEAARVAITRDQFPTLSTLLKIFTSKNVTDPRDAVYVLLSLSK
ncbi:hypothetical protein EG329_001761 [Mollisiaceae sp. DMI_Dod_QoI]|nr:hypothetical protein EG329_001761 [Helotiales sp. DMI_Dod_QoI]